MTIRRRKYASGAVAWQLNYSLSDGRRVQRAFAAKEDAQAEMARVREEMRGGGESLLMIPAGERAAILAAREALHQAGATITEAVEFFLRHAKPTGGAVTLSRLVEMCLEAKEEEGKRPRYLSQLKCSARALVNHLPADTWAHEVTSEQVQAWLSANQWAPKTWNVYLGDVRTVFQWGKQRGHVTLNPCDGVARKALDDGEIDFLSVDACARLLDRAAAAPVDCADEDFRDCLAYVALGLFCGPRPERELGRKEWSDVKLEDKLVVVSSGRSKTRARRVIDLPDNAVEWLRLCPRREGRIAPRNFRRKWRRLREACGLYATWPHNALRHTFATMHLAHHQDERRLQLLMGHGSAQMLYQSYRGLTTRSEAARFWELRPEAAGTRQEAQGSRQEAPQCEPGRCSMAGGACLPVARPQVMSPMTAALMVRRAMRTALRKPLPRVPVIRA